MYKESFERNFDFTNLTIVIPTFNRHKLLLDQLKIWSQTNARIIVLDGSILSLQLCQYDANRVNYFHVIDNVPNRISTIIGSISTEFVLFANDDDYFIMSGIEACISYLKLNPDISSCAGKIYSFKSDNQLQKIHCTHIYKKRYNPKLFANDYRLRVKELFYDYDPLSIYSVTRTQDWEWHWKLIIATYSNLTIDFQNFIEFLYEISSISNGKTKILNDLFMFKNHNHLSTNIEDKSAVSGNTFFDFWIHLKPSEQNLIISNIVHFSKYIPIDLKSDSKIFYKDIIVKYSLSTIKLKFLITNKFHFIDKSWNLYRFLIRRFYQGLKSLINFYIDLNEINYFKSYIEKIVLDVPTEEEKNHIISHLKQRIN